MTTKMSKRAIEVRDSLLADARKRFGKEKVIEWSDNAKIRGFFNSLAQSIANSEKKFA